jgi:hypothetical protein
MAEYRGSRELTQDWRAAPVSDWRAMRSRWAMKLPGLRAMLAEAVATRAATIADLANIVDMCKSIKLWDISKRRSYQEGIVSDSRLEQKDRQELQERWARELLMLAPEVYDIGAAPSNKQASPSR